MKSKNAYFSIKKKKNQFITDRDFLLKKGLFLPAQYKDHDLKGWRAHIDDMFITRRWETFSLSKCFRNTLFNVTNDTTFNSKYLETSLHWSISVKSFCIGPRLAALCTIRPWSKVQASVPVSVNIRLRSSSNTASLCVPRSIGTVLMVTTGDTASTNRFVSSNPFASRAIRTSTEPNGNRPPNFTAMHRPRPLLAPVTMQNVLRRKMFVLVAAILEGGVSLY